MSSIDLAHSNQLRVSDAQGSGVMDAPSESPDGPHSLPTPHLFFHPHPRPQARVFPDQPDSARDEHIQAACWLILPAATHLDLLHHCPPALSAVGRQPASMCSVLYACVPHHNQALQSPSSSSSVQKTSMEQYYTVAVLTAPYIIWTCRKIPDNHNNRMQSVLPHAVRPEPANHADGGLCSH